MRVGNRLFPYPVLNRDPALSGYKPEISFNLALDDEPIAQDGYLVFKGIHYNITEPLLINLIAQGKVKGTLIIECSASVFRESFDIDSNPRDLSIPLDEINGNVVVSCYLFADDDIHDFKSTGFLDEYSGYRFDIDKFDILAADDGIKFKVECDGTQYNKVSSIFVIAKIPESAEENLMTYQNKDKYIAIFLPEQHYKSYELIKTDSSHNNIAFAILALPVLAACLEEVKNIGSIDEIIESHSWFKAVCISYKRVKGCELTIEIYEDINKLELAQTVLNSAICNGITDFKNTLLIHADGGNDDDE